MEKKENNLFKEYEEWCVSNKKDPMDKDNLDAFKKVKEEKNDELEYKKIIEQQKSVFQAICNYCEIKGVKYCEEVAEDLNTILHAIVYAMAVTNAEKAKKDVDKKLKELFTND